MVDKARGKTNAPRWDTLRSLNARLLPVSLPPGDLEALSIVYLAEAAAAFDEMTRLNLDDQLRCQDETGLAQPCCARRVSSRQWSICRPIVTG